MPNGSWFFKARPEGRAAFDANTRMNTEPPFFHACIEPGERRFDAWPEQSLLQSLEQGGLLWPSSCRVGTCRTCMGHLIAGAVRYEMAWPGMTAEEKAEGCVLPCVAFPVSDVVLKDPFSS